MFQKLDIWELVKWVTPAQLRMVCVVIAIVAAVGVSHLFWLWHTGAIPDGLTVVAGGAAVVVAYPMIMMFVSAVFRLNDSNERLFVAKTNLDFQNAELEIARAALGQLNEELEARVKARTTELAEALRVAESASAAKSMFLANMSHELRTPLNGIIGYSEMLANRQELFPDLPLAQFDEYAGAINASGKNLHAMVSDLLELSKIECGDFDATLTSVPMNTLVRQVIEELTPTAQARNQTVEASLLPECILVRTDASAARQILTNLLSNAFKYSGDGATVSVSIEIAETSLGLVVVDQGIGISAEVISKITEPFSQFSDAHIASGQNIGLSLSISHKLCEFLGARLTLSSIENVGTTARVDFPLGAVEGQTESPMALVS